MNLKFFALTIALSFSSQSIASIDNPFGRTSRVDVGSDIIWGYQDGTANKTSKLSDNDGIFYQLNVGYSQMVLRLVDSSSTETAKALSFEYLTIDDVLLDGKTSAVFQWCLNNQQRHNRFLQQGLSVKKDICHNKGAEGLFKMTLNRATHELLKKTKRLTFIVKPYRKAVHVSFDVQDISTVFARIISGARVTTAAVRKSSAPPPIAKFLSKPAVKMSVSSPESVKLCKVKPPAGFSSITSVEYRCDDTAAKTEARSQIAGAVKKIRLARDKEKKLALERKQKSELTEAEKKREADAVLAIEQNMNKIRNEVAEKMIGMCKKKWAEGEHRCYCESYLEFAPEGITSDASCAGG